MELTNTNMDIFESSSAPASPRPSPPRSPPNVDVDTSLPPAKEAFAYFLGQAFSIPAGNFSDSLTRRPVGLSGRDNSGFSGVPTRNIAGESFEVGPPSKSEGVIDRLNRLTAEVMDIEAMITQYSAGPADPLVEKVIRPNELTASLAAVKERMEACRTSISAPPAARAQSTAPVLEDVRQRVARGQGVTYEVYSSTSQSKTSSGASDAVLEERIARLEGVLGSGVLATGTSGRSIAEEVKTMAAQVSLLDPERIHAIHRRAQAVTVDLDAIARHPAATTAERDRRIDELYNQFKAAEPLLQQLPVIIERLRALRTLHEEGARFATRIAQIEKDQARIAALLADNTTLQSKLDQSFKDNSEAVAANIKILSDRQAKLGGK